MTETEMRGEFDRAVQLDAFRLDAARREMAAGNLRVFCGHSDVARAPDILPRGPVGSRRHRETTKADAEVEWSVNLGIVELHQYVVAGDGELGGAEGDKGGDVKAAHADQIEARLAGREAELARVGILKSGFR